MKKRGVMNWYQIKKYLYYTHDDFIRDIIALHLKEGTLTDIYNYICKTSLFSIEDRFHGSTESIEDNICNEIITLFLDKRPIIRWYLNSHPLKTIFQHKACTDKLYADSFYKVQKNSHSSFEVICCCS